MEINNEQQQELRGDCNDAADVPEPSTTNESKPFHSGEQRISFNGLEVHFTMCAPAECCDLFLELREKLSYKETKAVSYLQ